MNVCMFEIVRIVGPALLNSANFDLMTKIAEFRLTPDPQYISPGMWFEKIAQAILYHYSELSLFRSPMGLAQVAGISRWLHFRVPRDTRGCIRDSVTCIFFSMQGHCDWLVAS